MTAIIVNHANKKGIIAPCKCGSAAFENYLITIQDDNAWEGYNVSMDLPLAHLAIKEYKFSDYEFVGIIRDPVEWYVSGFRFVQKMIATDKSTKKLDKEWKFPNTFTEHLLLVKHLHETSMEYEPWWKDHCFVNPTMHFPKNIRMFDIKDWISIEFWLKTFWSTWHPFHIINQTENTIPYPTLDNDSIFLLKQLHRRYWNIQHLYNIDQSIQQYVKKW